MIHNLLEISTFTFHTFQATFLLLNTIYKCLIIIQEKDINMTRLLFTLLTVRV